MGAAGEDTRAPLWPGLVALGLATVYLTALLAAEKQRVIIALLAVGIAAVLVAAWFRLLDRVSRSGWNQRVQIPDDLDFGESLASRLLLKHREVGGDRRLLLE